MHLVPREKIPEPNIGNFQKKFLIIEKKKFNFNFFFAQTLKTKKKFNKQTQAVAYALFYK